MKYVAYRLVVCLIGMALLSACASPPSRFYTLSPIQGAPPGRTSTITVAVGPVTIPEAVNRPEIVVQVGANQVALDELNRWAAPLQTDIQRVVMENLVHLLGTSGVSRYPQGPIAVPDFRVQIEVLRFESAPGDAAFLDAIWRVRRKSENEVITGRTTARVPLSEQTYQALAAAHSRALGTLSRDLAGTILSLEDSAR